MLVRFLSFFFLSLSAMFLAVQGTVSAQSCQEFAEDFLKQSHTATVASQYREYLAKSLDTQNATKFSLGPNWRTLTPEQRKKFHDIYSKYVVYKYASQMEKYKIMEYKVTSTSNDEKRKDICNVVVIIKTILNNQVSEVKLSNVISLKDAKNPLLQDIIFENISVLQLQRDEVESLLKSKGFDATLKAFQDFIKNNK